MINISRKPSSCVFNHPIVRLDAMRYNEMQRDAVIVLGKFSIV